MEVNVVTLRADAVRAGLLQGVTVTVTMCLTGFFITGDIYRGASYGLGAAIGSLLVAFLIIPNQSK